MKVDKFDIGGEIISILTKGMYPDPKDAIREYIQNAIDANASNVEIKVRQNSVVIEDNGSGMDYKTLRKAVRVGVSDKTPGTDVGFMGIGIYSAFHLCDQLLIFTKKEKKDPQYLKMDFEGMRLLLKEQKEQRLSGEIQSEDLTDLQTLLERFIQLPEEGMFPREEYPIKKSGTRIEIVGLNSVLDESLNKFDELSNYLQDVVPLPFDKKNFLWGKEIEDRIRSVVEGHGEKFEIVNLRLQVGTRTEDLYRPYTNDIFSNNIPLEPKFYEIKGGGIFFGMSWGCLNSSRDRLSTFTKDYNKRNLRGFILKKQGFSIGTREMLSKYFGSSNSYYHRYTGEIIIINKKILPNASRNDVEASELKKLLYFQIVDNVAPFYTGIGTKFQEQDLAREKIAEETANLNRILGEYNPYEDNYNNYLSHISELDFLITNVNRRIKKLASADEPDAKQLKEKAESLRKEISQKIETSKKGLSRSRPVEKATQIAKAIDKLKITPVAIKFDNLLEVLKKLGIDIDEDQRKIFEIIDDKFIKASALTKSQYYQLLNELKSDFENGND